MKVFITGATGYIGFNVARAFRRAGHQVWGLTRNENKGKLLAQQEIQPVIGNMQQPESFAEIAENCDVLIHAAADYQNDTIVLDNQTVETFLDVAKRGAHRKTIIYTSGVWVIGNTGGKTVDESTSLNPITVVAWRPDVENMVLHAAEANGVVIRPGCVYGKQGGLTGMWFDGAVNQETFSVVGDGDNRWAMVHVDDLADAYLRAAKSGLSGEAFNITDRSRSPVREMVNVVAKTAGYKDEIQFIPLDKARQSMGDFAEALAINQQVDSGKAQRKLNWKPKHEGFINDVDIYFESWKASQG